MYIWRGLTAEQRERLLEERKRRGFPPHSPPHPMQGQGLYLITAACYEHHCHMNSEERRKNILDVVFALGTRAEIEILAWVVLPNHYHLLVAVPNLSSLSRVLRHVHGSTAQQWNKEENTLGRKVWFRFTDRAIRSERHYYTTLNYIHYNPCKHGWANSPYDWMHSSVHWYLETRGREWLRDLWVAYPTRDYGREWDAEPPNASIDMGEPGR
jgi:putative transposase